MISRLMWEPDRRRAKGSGDKGKGVASLSRHEIVDFATAPTPAPATLSITQSH